MDNHFFPAARSIAIAAGVTRHLTGGLRLLSAAAVVDSHVRTFACEPDGDRLADPGGSAGDQNVLSF